MNDENCKYTGWPSTIYYYTYVDDKGQESDKSPDSNVICAENSNMTPNIQVYEPQNEKYSINLYRKVGNNPVKLVHTFKKNSSNFVYNDNTPLPSFDQYYKCPNNITGKVNCLTNNTGGDGWTKGTCTQNIIDQCCNSNKCCADGYTYNNGYCNKPGSNIPVKISCNNTIDLPIEARPRFTPISLASLSDNNFFNYYKTDNGFGLRISWVDSASNPTSPYPVSVSVNGKKYDLKLISNPFYYALDPNSNPWCYNLSSVQVQAIAGGNQNPNDIIFLDKDGNKVYETKIIIPVRGSPDPDDGFIHWGDPMIKNDISLGGRKGVQCVINQTFNGYKNKYKFVTFGGDNFYSPENASETEKFWSGDPSGRGGGQKLDKDFYNKLLIGIPGNHDYNVAGCGSCGDSCNNDPNFPCEHNPSQNCGNTGACGFIQWYAQDTYSELWENYSKKSSICNAYQKLPWQNTFGVYAIGQFGIITWDNTWCMNSIFNGQNWDNMWKNIINYFQQLKVKTVIMLSHWNSRDHGAASVTNDCYNFLASKGFDKNFKLLYITNHNHINQIASDNNGIILGGGGFSDNGNSCNDSNCSLIHIPGNTTSLTDFKKISSDDNNRYRKGCGGVDTNANITYSTDSSSYNLCENVIERNNNLNINNNSFTKIINEEDALYRFNPYAHMNFYNKNNKPHWDPLSKDEMYTTERTFPNFWKNVKSKFDIKGIDEGYPSCQSLINHGYICPDNINHNLTTEERGCYT